MWLLSRKTTIEDSGLLDGFCDCHCHLLPGVDDGVQQTEETLQILQEWERLGVKEIWLTPHIMEDIPNRPDELQRRFEMLKADYQGTIRLQLAAEHMMDGPFSTLLETGQTIPFGEKGEHLLVETSYYIPPMHMEGLISDIRKKRYDPILAHPERYQYMDVKDYRKWKDMGVLLQLNLPSLVGAYGYEVMKKAEWLLKENMYDFFGTDTHSMNQVNYFLKGTLSKKTAKKLKESMNLSLNR